MNSITKKTCIQNKYILILLWVFLFFTHIVLRNNYTIQSILVISFLQFFISLLALKLVGYKLYSFAFLFAIFTYIFHCGQLFLKLFNINVDYPFDIFARCSVNIIKESFIFYIGVYFSLILGFLITKTTKKQAQQINRNSNFYSLNRVLCVGKALFFVGLLPTLYVDLTEWILFIKGGYLETYKSTIHGFVYIIAYCMEIGALMMIIGKQNEPQKAKTIACLVGLYSILTMFTGGRLYQVAYLFLLLYIYIKLFVRTLNIKKVLFFCLGGYIGLVLLSVIGEIRNLGLKGYLDFWEVFLDALSLDIIWETIGTYGGTAIALCHSIRFFPDYINFAYGASYYTAIMDIFPNINNLLAPFRNDWMFVLNFPGAYRKFMGGTFVGELYYNFGGFGVIMALFVGLFVGWYSNALDKFLSNGNWIAFSLLLPLYAYIFAWVRGYFSELIRPFVYIGVIILFFYLLFNESKNKCVKLDTAVNNFFNENKNDFSNNSNI